MYRIHPAYLAWVRQRSSAHVQLEHIHLTSPTEFSEIYAAYFSGKLKPVHPAVSWLKTLETAEIE